MTDLEWLAITLTSRFIGNVTRRFCIYRAHCAPAGLEHVYSVGAL